MKDFFKSPRTKKVLKFLLWFLLWFVMANVGLVLIVINGEGHYTRDGKELFYVIVMVICLVSIIFLLPILACFVKPKTTLILGATVGYYFLFIADLIYIPFYYLDPAYYKYQSECKKMPKPVIYDEDYWNIWSDLNYPFKEDEQGRRYSLSKSGEKVYNELWDYKRISTETWWGSIEETGFLHDQKLVAKGLTYDYDGLVFRFGASGIGFMTEWKYCKNYEQKR